MAISNPSTLVVAAGSRPNSDGDGGTAALPARDALRRFTRVVRALDPGEEAPPLPLAPPLLNEDPEIDMLRRCLRDVHPRRGRAEVRWALAVHCESVAPT